MTRDDILAKMRAAVGDPSSGPVAEILPVLADALADTDTPKRTKRVIDPAQGSSDA